MERSKYRRTTGSSLPVMGQDLVVLQQASSIVTSLVVTGSRILTDIRTTGIVASGRRQSIRDDIAALRAQEIANTLANLGFRNIELIAQLYEMAEGRAGLPGYGAAYESANQTARLLRDNLDNLARRLR